MRNSDNTVNRRKAILAIISEDGQVFVKDLSTRLKVSQVTIRNDLHQLEKKNQLIRARGGAILSTNAVSSDQFLSEKSKMNYKEKAGIGKLAASLIKDGEAIILDSGSTTAEIAKNLENFKSLTIITNAVNIINQLIKYPDLNVIVPGGYLRKKSLSFVGPIAEKNFRSLYVDKLFLGVDGIDITTGIYTPNLEEAFINTIMVEMARQVVLVADSSKFNRRSLAFICSLEDIDIIITDDRIRPEEEKLIRDKGIELVIASAGKS